MPDDALTNYIIIFSCLAILFGLSAVFVRWWLDSKFTRAYLAARTRLMESQEQRERHTDASLPVPLQGKQVNHEK